MKNTIKKILLLVAVVVTAMLCFAFSASALEQTGQCGDNVYWNYNKSTGELVINGSGLMYDYHELDNQSPFYGSDIVSVIINNGVTNVGKGVFFCCYKLENVSLPNSIVNICDYAFYSCESLANIIIPDSVLSIGESAFSGAGFFDLTIPNGVLSIGHFSFSGCKNLTNVILPNSVKNIADGAFNFCTNLAKIKIPSSVEYIGFQAFEDCWSLTSIEVEKNNQYYSSDNYGVLFNKNKTILFRFPENNETASYVIPYSVTEIYSSAFENCDNLVDIEMQKNVTTMGVGVFYRCLKLESITIPESITRILCYTFEGCSKLKNVYYCGTQKQWENIEIDYTGNKYIINATIHYGVDGSEQFPAGYDFDWNKYAFFNLNETISSDIYQKAYGKVKGVLLHKSKEMFGKHGHCYGMTSTSAALLSYPTAINYFKSPISTDYYVSTMNELSPTHTSDLFGVDLSTFIKYGHIYQYDKDVQNAEKASKNNLVGLYDSVKSYVNGNNNPVIINIYHDSFWGRKDGHSILAVGIRETNDNYIILINDSNIWNELQEFKISKNFDSWSYEVVECGYEYSSNNGHFTYSFPSSVIYNVGLLLNENSNSFMSADNNLVSSTNKISSDIDLEEILPATGSNQDDNESNFNLYWLDEEDKKINLTSLSDDNQIIVSDTETSLQIALSNNDKAEFYVNDEDNSSVVFDASMNNEIILTTYEDDKLIETKIAGTSNGTEITATQTETGLVVTGISDGTVTLSKDDEVIATQEIKDAESEIEITYDADGSSDDLDVEYHSHSYSSTETKTATCKEKGEITYTCSCGDTYTEEIPVNSDNHTGETEVRNASESTCKVKGYTGDTYCLDCDKKIADGESKELLDHSYNADGICEMCGKDRTENCTHICHQGGFMGFIWKIIRFFFKLFGSNPVCECGMKHY